MKVVLINPPRAKPQIADFPPLGLGFIGAISRQEGHQVKILDAAAWTWGELQEAISLEAPDLIGITCWTIERGQTFKAANLAKETTPRAKIVIGGPHASAFPHHMFLKTPADYVVIGEGETTFRELLGAISSDRDVSRIQGLAYRWKGEARKTSPRPLIKDLDSIPFVLHDEFDYKCYRGMYDTSRRAAAIITSRGCPFKCIYCSSAVYWHRRLRKRSVENVLKEIEMLYYQHGIRSLLFFDDNLILDRNRCIALFKGIFYLRLDLISAAEGSVRVDPELLGWMKRAGCYRIDFGVESGSPKILKNINKPFTVEDTRQAFRLCREAGIRPNAYLIIGAPGETRHTIRETVKLMREIQPTIGQVNPGVWILPDTELHEISLRKGVISEERWLASNETFVYTGEHSERRLMSFARQFDRGIALHAGIVRYFRVLLQQSGVPRLLRPIRNILRDAKDDILRNLKPS